MTSIGAARKSREAFRVGLPYPAAPAARSPLSHTRSTPQRAGGLPATEPEDDASETRPASSGVGVKVREFSPGSRIASKYLVEGDIGEGGLGVVVKARHMQLEQPVAIKYLKPYAL